MPLTDNTFRKTQFKKQDLDKFDVFLEEEVNLGNLVVSKYFNVSNFPGVVTRGNSFFEIQGSSLLRPEVELKTEILDSTGKPVFHYAVPKNPIERKLKVTMQVTSDISAGVGKLVILGELNPLFINVPEEFRDTYNVRLVGLINFNTILPNTQPIKFFVPPRMVVSEQVKGELKLPADSDTILIDVAGTGDMSGDGIGFTATANNVGKPDLGVTPNIVDDELEEFDATEGEKGDFSEFDEVEVSLGEEEFFETSKVGQKFQTEKAGLAGNKGKSNAI